MEISIVTLDDLQAFKSEIFDQLDKVKSEILMNITTPPAEQEVSLLKSYQVQKLLGISAGTLQTLRVNGTIPYSKVGGVIFYDKQDIMKILEDNKRNS
jgi:hypothetical protein